MAIRFATVNSYVECLFEIVQSISAGGEQATVAIVIPRKQEKKERRSLVCFFCFCFCFIYFIYFSHYFLFSCDLVLLS